MSAERGTSISLSNDKLTLSKMYVMSHQSQLIKSLAAPSSFLWPSLQTERGEKNTQRALAQTSDNSASSEIVTKKKCFFLELPITSLGSHQHIVAVVKKIFTLNGF